MAPSTLSWTPEPQILQALKELAQQRGQSLDALLTEAIVTYLDAQKSKELESTTSDTDPLIGLFAGSPNLATESEETLQGITESGWTWK